MKIVELDEFYSEHGGGVRRYTDQKLLACAELGHQTVIIAPGPKNREVTVPGGKIVWVKSPRIPVDHRYHMFYRRAEIDAAIEHEAPDVLVGASPWRGGWIAGTWRSKSGNCDPVKALFMHADPMAVYAYTIFGSMMKRASIDKTFGWFWSYLRRLSALFDTTLVASDWLAKRFGTYGLKRVQPVPFGVELDVFQPQLRDESLRAEMLSACGLPSTATLALSVSRHHPEKRLHTIFETVEGAQGEKPVGLFVVGDGLIRRWVERWAARAQHIHIAGQISERVPPVYAIRMYS